MDNKTESVTMRITQSLKEVLDTRAKETGIPASTIARSILDVFIRELSDEDIKKLVVDLARYEIVKERRRELENAGDNHD